MKPISFLFFFLLCSLSARAQTPAILCGNDIFNNIVRTRHPELAAGFDATFEAARQAKAQPRSPLTINVVVHVVWKDAAENLSDDIIYDQIAVLNADYNRLNADTGNLRPQFQPVAGNADIHFNLAAIERVQTSQLFEVDVLGNSLLTELKHNSQGGSDAWDTEHYLNIWVCKIQPLAFGPLVLGQVLGFAFPPNDLSNWPADSGAPNADEDGVVIDYRAFGSNNPNPLEFPGVGAITVKGRTPTHEVGHYLGLRHIWGDGGLLGPNDCAQSDGVDDTPFANAQSNFDCDITKNTCPQVEAFYGADMPDLIENYMDYASEDCMNMFTKGQVDLMRNVLTGPRSGLLDAVSTQQPELAAAGFRLSPNPANGRVRVDLSEAAASGSSLNLYSAEGRLLRSLAVPEGAAYEWLDLNGLPAGLYMVQLYNGGHWAAERLVVR